MYKDLIKKEGKERQELKLTEERATIVGNLMVNALKHYREKNGGKLPVQILIYRDGVGGPTMEPKVKNMEIQYVLQTI